MFDNRWLSFNVQLVHTQSNLIIWLELVLAVCVTYIVQIVLLFHTKLSMTNVHKRQTIFLPKVIFFPFQRQILFTAWTCSSLFILCYPQKLFLVMLSFCGDVVYLVFPLYCVCCYYVMMLICIQAADVSSKNTHMGGR